MSQESTLWLNHNVLIGNGKKAWHFDPALQPDESNHYDGFIPVDDVVRRLFHWKAKYAYPTWHVLDEDGVLAIEDRENKGIIRPDTQEVLGVFKDGYKIHDYEEWLLKNIATIIDADLNIVSAGLLQKGAVAWVQIEAPEDVLGPGEVRYRPYIMGFSSMNGTLGTGFASGAVFAQCDNTVNAAIHSSTFKIKVKHTRNSLNRITDVREALGVLQNVRDNYDAELEALLAEEVSEDRFNRFNHEWAGGDKVFTQEKGRSLTMAEHKKEALTRLWTSDPRVEPWRGTALGVVQAVNTYAHWEGIVRGANRWERNKLNALNGKFDLLDQSTVNLLEAIPA